MWNISNLSREKVMHQHFYVSFPDVFLDLQQQSLLGMGIEGQYYCILIQAHALSVTTHC